VWRFQTVHHDIWNFDNPNAPVLLDVNVNGRRTPILIKTTGGTRASCARS